jgi:hypothetical protein
MDAKPREEQTGPLGVLACIMAGFETLGQNVWPLAFPLALDLFLWLGPQLSVAPLIEWYITLSAKMQPSFSPQVVEAMEQFAERFNLFSLLNAIPFLSIPSLISHHAPGTLTPLGERVALPVGNVLALLGCGIVLIPVGLVMGSLYLTALSGAVQAVRGGVPAPPASGLAMPAAKELSAANAGAAAANPATMAMVNTVLKLIRVLTFSGVLVGLGVVLVPIWIVVVFLAMSVAEILGLIFWGLSVGAAGFLLLHLMFVVHGVTLGERRLLRAVVESIALIRFNFAPSAGLVILGLLIYQGMGYIWSLPEGNSWLLLLGILCNSGIATAMVTATFIFYQERIVHLPGLGVMATKT